MLLVAGTLDDRRGGRAVDILKQPSPTRRSVYAFIDRYDLPRLFGVFDFANPDVSIARRVETTIPQQALFMLNSPFVIEQSRHVAARSQQEDLSNQQRVERLFQIVYGRTAHADEIQFGTQFVDQAAKQTDPKLSPWEKLAQALLMSNEFVYVD